MRLAGRSVLHDFVNKHADARGPIAAWVAEVEAAAWKTPADLKSRYASASFLANNRVVFNIKGNTYRLVVVVVYVAQSVVVEWAGSHAEYTKRY